MRKIISLICLLLPLAAFADQLEIRENAPDRYVVVKGDTLWDISAKFFKDPWKWPQIWGLNKQTIKDPHWIYPGNVVVLDRAAGTLHVTDGSMPDASGAANTTASGDAPTAPDATPMANASGEDVIKWTPTARELRNSHDAIPAIPLKEIGPFLARPLVIEEDALDRAPTLVGTLEHRVLLGTDDIAYVRDLPKDKGTQWQLYRPGKTFKDPETDEVLGIEVSYLGDSIVESFGDPSTLRITRAIHEISKGDRFAQTTTGFASNYVPHAPDKMISAKIISIYGGVLQAGQNAILVLNKGQRDGLENGHVMALYQKGETLKSGGFFSGEKLQLPDVRYGLAFVFRVFNKVSYALVLETSLPVQLQDSARTP